MKKQIKKNIQRRNQVEEKIEYDHDHELTMQSEWKKLGVIVVVLMAVLAIVYLLIGFFVTGEFKKDDEPVVENTEVDDTPSFDDSVILAGEAFTQSDDKYYVYFSNSGDTDSLTYYATLLSNETMLDAPVYYVDLSEGFNMSYYDATADSNVNPKDASELVITSLPTLLVFENNELVSYLEDSEAMAYIDELTTESE